MQYYENKMDWKIQQRLRAPKGLTAKQLWQYVLTDVKGVYPSFEELLQTYQRLFPELLEVLTGDLNAAQVEWIVQYRIKDPYKFLFRATICIFRFRVTNCRKGRKPSTYRCTLPLSPSWRRLCDT